MITLNNQEPDSQNSQDFTLDIEDYSGRNFDTDVLDTIVETSHSEPGHPTSPETTATADEILDEEHWSSDSFDELKVEKEF